MKILSKFEKTLICIIKLLMFFCLILSFFCIFSINFPQIKTINRTSVILLFALVAFLYASIKMYGGFPIGKKQAKDITISAILGTLIGDFLTFITIHIMNASSINYYKFYSEYIKSAEELIKPKLSSFLTTYFKNEVYPSFVVFILTFTIQIIIIYIFAKISNTIYFKINKPKRTMVIYDSFQELISLVDKIKKNPLRWNIFELIKYNDKNILKKIQQNEAIFFSNIPKNERTLFLNYCYRHDKDVYLYPDFCDVIIHCSTNLTVDDMTVFSITDYKMSFEQRLIKRLGDILLSTAALILTSPISILAAIAIKLYDKGPIIFKQKRLTINGKQFSLLKFRSMNVDSEKNIGATMVEKNDYRITPIGKFLRRFRIDEIPQFLNILKGDLSVVGPRPERIEHIERFEKKLPEFKYRLKVKAGLTGLAQIMGKYSTTPKDKLTLDLSYIQKYSLWLDLKIILCTLIVFLKPESTQGIEKIDKQTIEFVNSKLKNKRTSH